MTPVDPAQVGSDLATSAGDTLVSTAVSVAPIVVGVLAAFWAIRFALKKIGLGGTAR